MQLSCDGVAECKSNGVSLDVYSFKMINCKQIYPFKIIRPLNKYKINHTEKLQSVIDDLLRSQCKIAQYLADNLKRATARECLNHAALYPCEYCFAKGERIVAKVLSQQKDKIELNLSLIEEKIAQLGSKSGKEYQNLKSIKEDLQQQARKMNMKKSHIVWPYSTKNAKN